MKRIFFAFLLVIPCIANAADEMYYDPATQPQHQTTYTETPVRSYYAYPDDQNFIPENDFMQRTDSLDYDQNIVGAKEYAATQMPGVQFAERPTVICRDFGCTMLNDRITRTFLFNSLSNIFMMNNHSRVYTCEADPFSRSCLQSGISFPVRSGIANAMVKIPKATISQVNITPGMSRASVGLTFDFLVNGTDRRCEPTVMDIIVPINTQATLTAQEFSCNMTSDGITSVSIMMNIDYIDLDYGILGGYYSFGLQGQSSGGGTGYALFKTEYSGRGMKFRASLDEGATGLMTIQPGEYAVEPMRE